MANLDQVKVKEFDPRFLSIIFDKDFSKVTMDKKDQSKVALFEKGLANEISKSDTIEATIEKIVKMALACEFGPSLVAKPAAKKMVSVISRGIMGNSDLRKSALIIADRFASGQNSKAVALKGKRKLVING